MEEKIFVSSSLIQEFLYKGNSKEYCQRYVREVILEKKYKKKTTMPMDEGLYFETLCLGSGRDGQQLTDLPRGRLTKEEEREIIIARSEGRIEPKGKMLTSQHRILSQYRRFEIKCATHQISVIKGINTQVKLFKQFKENERVILVGDLDLCPTTILFRKPHPKTKHKMNLTTIDLKLTGHIDNTFGKFCYGSPDQLDDTQGKMYHELVRDLDLELNEKYNPGNLLKHLFTEFVQEVISADLYLFYIWVFDYKKEKLDDKFIEIEWDINKRRELYECVRKTVAEVDEVMKGYKTNPMKETCELCPVTDCKDRYEYETI
ncbi:hypothetical protein A2Z67_02540 [Candidatus Woesebacteria bacterium RBG_13_36_22]|uniref:PD-(D/E)XK endonuclease-like domain-containing protein n=1 Tax=Candidatus Woesebacteria bacterium RBG_13_36_22 TaxID=1802478 RepID=A0A1F7X1S5_9BACT|nr:MAG: hypothetical protein A2Z67_02540 [Candidatus Woesebacteria bacterium RBG_13_36_22]